MIRFLVVDESFLAVPLAMKRGWVRIGASRYVTPERDDVRVVERVSHLHLPVGGIVLERGPGYEDMLTDPDQGRRGVERRERAEAFEALVASGGARWKE